LRAPAYCSRGDFSELGMERGHAKEAGLNRCAAMAAVLSHPTDLRSERAGVIDGDYFENSALEEPHLLCHR